MAGDEVCLYGLKREFLAILELEAGGSRAPAVERLLELYLCAWNASPDILAHFSGTTRAWSNSLAASCSRGCIMPPITLFIDLLSNLELRGEREAAAGLMKIQDRLFLAHRLSTDLPDADALTALMYARRGLVHRRFQHFDSARRDFLKAVELHPRFPPYLHVLATLDEKRGEYGSARQYLTRLVELSPDDSTGRLRLALVQRRLGRKSGARQNLEVLVWTVQLPAWPREIAVQELARLLKEAGDEEGALQILLKGLEDFPESQALALELSFFAQHTRLDPVAILEAEVLRRANERADTPRVLYNEWPKEEMKPFEKAWRDGLRRTRAALQEALPLLRQRLRDRP